MSPLRFAELFAGAGGLTLGLERAGWVSAWHAEIADAPRAILTHHWPEVPLYGDVTALDGKALTLAHGPILLLAGGSPCQDLSVAGKRAGMAEGSGTRSSLFYEQVRLWDETGADLCLWENVDGARSSNEGQDFGHVLRAFVGAAVPVPSDGWRSAGVAAGPRGVAAWRVLDAQFFGVPQRRRRVFVLGTRTGSVDPAQVLSLAESVRGDTPSSGEAREGTAEGVDGCVVFALRGRDDGAQLEVSGSVTSSLRGAEGGSSRDMVFDALNSCADDIAHSLRSNMDRASGYGGVIAFGSQNSAAQGASASASASAKCAPTLDKSKVPAVLAYAFGSHAGSDGEATNASHDSGGPVGFGLNEELTPSLRAGRTQAICVTGEVTHALTHEGADASEDGTGRGTPICVRQMTGDRFKCLTCGARFGVNDYETNWVKCPGCGEQHPGRLFDSFQDDHDVLAADFAQITNKDNRSQPQPQPQPLSPTLNAKGDIHVFNETGHEKWTDETVAGSLNAHEAREAHTIVADQEIASTLNGSQRQQVDGAMVATVGIPRRLTPRECERLQGWGDDHTLVPDAKGKLLSDAARYKAIGNGVASNVAQWIGERLCLAVEQPE